MTATTPARPKWMLAVIAAIIVAVAALAAVFIVNANAGQSAEPSPPAASATEATATAPTEAAATDVPTPTAGQLPSQAPVASVAPPAAGEPVAPEAAPVAPTEVAVQGAVEVELVQIEQVDGQAIAPGEIAGPAIRVTVEVRNGADAPLNAGLIVVNAAFGPERVPGNSLMQPGGMPFEGTIEPGGAAQGVYLFEAGNVDLADALIGVEAVPGEPVFTFRGDLR